MKRRDVVILLFAIAIFMVAGYIAATQLMPKDPNAAQGTKVEVIGEIGEGLSEDTLATLRDPSVVVDYNSPVDLTGLNNTAPFGR